MASQIPPGRVLDGPSAGYTAIMSGTFRRVREILYWDQRLSLGQLCTVTHRPAECGVNGVFLHNHKLERAAANTWRYTHRQAS